MKEFFDPAKSIDAEKKVFKKSDEIRTGQHGRSERPDKRVNTAKWRKFRLRDTFENLF